MRPFTFLLPFLALALMATPGCKDELEEDDDWCLKNSYKKPLVVDVELDKTFTQFLTIDSAFNTRSPSRALDLVLKYYVAAYSKESEEPIAISSSFDKKVEISLRPGKYDLVSWVDYESESADIGANFYTDDFTELLLRNKYSYSDASIDKLGYWGKKSASIAYTTDSISVLATPAMGQYRLIATDTVAYKPDKIVVTYSSKIPAAINAKDGSFKWWWDDISFSTTPNGKTLASDFVLSQKTETTVTAIVEIYDADGYLRARKKDLKIPLINGGITTIRGNFLSTLEVDDNPSNGSGISINPEWDASFDIEI